MRANQLTEAQTLLEQYRAIAAQRAIVAGQSRIKLEFDDSGGNPVALFPRGADADAIRERAVLAMDARLTPIVDQLAALGVTDLDAPVTP